MHRFIVSLLLVLIIWHHPFPAIGSQTDNARLLSVYTDRTISIDASLDDWTDQPEIFMCMDTGTLANDFSAYLKSGFNNEYLYLAIEVVDKTPLQNFNDPASSLRSGWRGDAVQLRFKAPDASVPVHILMYFYTPGRRPVLYIQHNDMRRGEGPVIEYRNALEAGAKLAMRANRSGNGYILEASLPWRLLLGEHAQVSTGQRMAMGVEVLWGSDNRDSLPLHRLVDLVNPRQPQRSFFWMNPDAWGELALVSQADLTDLQREAQLKTASISSVAKAGSGVPIEYKLPEDGNVTLVIDSKEGIRVRNLISDEPRKAGLNREYWDGNDENGTAIENDGLIVRGLVHQDLDVIYQFHFGSPGQPPWPVGNSGGGWLANHTNPYDVVADEKAVYVSAARAEGPHAVMALDYQGNKQWGALGWGHAGPLARYKNYLYVVSEPEARPPRRNEDVGHFEKVELSRIDIRTQAVTPFPDGATKRVIWEWDVARDGAERSWFGKAYENNEFGPAWTGAQAQSVTALNGYLYLSLYFSNRILKLDPDSGLKLAEIEVDKPSGLAIWGNQLLVISGRHILSIDVVSNKFNNLISDGLDAPIGLAVDKLGNIYVSDWGRSMSVKVFGREGDLIRTIGKPGGRSIVGRYDAHGMLFPRGIALDKDGRLWVVEDYPSPRRISVWNSNGDLLQEKLGGIYYGGGGVFVLPDNMQRGIVLGNLVELDWDSGDWRVLSTLWAPRSHKEIIGYDHTSALAGTLRRDGREYLVHSSGGSNGSHRGVTTISELINDIAVPRVAIGSVLDALPTLTVEYKNGMTPPPLLADNLWSSPSVNELAKRILPWMYSGSRAGNKGAFNDNRGLIGQVGPGKRQRITATDNNFIWTDRNADGAVDDKEVVFFKLPSRNGVQSSSLMKLQWSAAVVDKDFNVYLTSRAGAEITQWKFTPEKWLPQGVPVYSEKASKVITRNSGTGEAAWVGKQGGLLTLADSPTSGAEGRTDPLTMYDAKGIKRWSISNPDGGIQPSHDAPISARGKIVAGLGVLGSTDLDGVGEIIGIKTNYGMADFITADGLFIGSVFKDTRAAPQWLPENPQRGDSIKSVSNGGEWFGGQMFQDPKTKRTYILSGRNAGIVSELTGLETIRKLGPFSVGVSDKADVVLQDRVTNRVIEAGKRPVYKVMSGQGFNDSVLGLGVGVSWQSDAEHKAKAAWTWDEDKLYLSVEVMDDTPFINQGDDYSQLYKTGDAVIFDLRTAANDDSPGIRVGDIRLLVSTFQGGTKVVLYRFKSSNRRNSMDFHGTGVCSVDQVLDLDAVKTVINRSAKGYRVSLVIDLDALEFHPMAGQYYLGDFGIVYSDPQGTRNVLRMHWADHQTGQLNDTAEELCVAPKRWGLFSTDNHAGRGN
jgi:sugar lactone lactonase YvrE